MAGNGPPPNPNAVRRNPRVGLTQLPAGGRTGRTPAWPLPPDPRLTAKIRLLEEDLELLEERELDDELSRTERTKLTRTRERIAIARAELQGIEDGEKKIWRELWKTPQATMWETLKWNRGVALYARHQAAAELGSMHDSKEARQRAEALGLTPKGMRGLMWTIATDELAQRRPQQQAATGTDGPPPRRRLRAVDPKPESD